jgi:tripartite-type tricarboxylate transporter receptor subunit TctC
MIFLQGVPSPKVRWLCMKIAALAVAGSMPAPAGADDVAQFYSGKTISIIVGHEVGSGFDVYARTLQRHFSRHVPGSPNVIVQNMVGASGVTAANWLFNAAPKDGSVIATFVYAVPIEAILGNPAAKFEPAKFTWIGNMEQSAGVCAVSRAAGILTFEDMLRKETLIGATASTGPLAKAALTVRNLLGVKMKLVTGYKGSADLKLAIGRGEVHGVCGLVMSTFTSFWRDEYERGDIRPVLQLSGQRLTEPTGVPSILDLATSVEDRQAIELILGSQALGRLYASPPGVPAARVDALRTAMSATLKDPEFRADAAKTHIDISPMSGAEVESFLAKLAAIPADVIERAKRASTP